MSSVKPIPTLFLMPDFVVEIAFIDAIWTFMVLVNGLYLVVSLGIEKTFIAWIIKLTNLLGGA